MNLPKSAFLPKKVSKKKLLAQKGPTTPMAVYTASQTYLEPGKLFEPDALLVSQFYASTQRAFQSQPELRLMAAILEDAVSTAITDPRRCSRQQLRDLDDTTRWITHQEDSDWIFSFANVCEALDINPEYLRQGLIRKMKQIHPLRSDMAQRGAAKTRPSESRLNHRRHSRRGRPRRLFSAPAEL